MKDNCKKCGGIKGGYDPQTGEELPDPCLGKLPGVISACCGHGQFKSYIIFRNGTRLGFTDIQVTKNHLSGNGLKRAIQAAKHVKII